MMIPLAMHQNIINNSPNYFFSLRFPTAAIYENNSKYILFLITENQQQPIIN